MAGGRRWGAAQGRSAGPAAPLGTTQAGAADSTLMQREGSGTCQLVLRKDQSFSCALNHRNSPTPPSAVTSGNKASLTDRPPLPLFPPDLCSLCPRCLDW